jgi:subtilisin family serine protease
MLSGVPALAGGGSAYTDPRVIEALERGQPSVPVLVALRGPGGQAIGPSASREEIERTLKSAAYGARERLAGRLESTDLKDARVLWIANALALPITRPLLESLSRQPEVESVSLDRRIRLEPGRVGSLSADAPGLAPGLVLLGLEKVWQSYGVTGKDVRVGHMDIGVDASHPALEGRVVAFKDMAAGGQTPHDPHGHGTHTAGIIAAARVKGRAVGVAPGALLVSVKAFNDAAETQESWLLDGFQWMVDPDGDPATPDGVRVSSNSWGDEDHASTVFWEATRRMTEMGITVVAASGNSGASGSVHAPGSYPFVLCSGAIANDLTLAPFSNRGPVTWQGQVVLKPDFVMPGVDVVSTLPGGRYGAKSGTSMATPHLAGVAALLLEANPSLSPGAIARAMRESSRDLGDAGPDPLFGHGLVDVQKAVGAVFAGGLVEGTVRGASSEAVDATVEVPGEGRTLRVTDGGFSLHLKEGERTLTFEAFGYRPASRALTVAQGDHHRLDVSLERLPRGLLTGTVRSSHDQSLLTGTLRLEGRPVQGDVQDGRFSVALPVGQYTLAVRAAGHAPWAGPVEVREGAQTHVDIVMDLLPPVLLVDDDGARDFERYYRQALQDVAIGFSDWDAGERGFPSLADLIDYPTVVWFTGNRAYGTLDRAGQQTLTEYVTSGGSLLASGQNLGFDLSFTARPFYGSVLGARFAANTVRTSGLDAAPDYPGPALPVFGLGGTDGADNQRSPDAIDAAHPRAKVILRYRADGAPGAALLGQAGRGTVAYLAFGLEGVTPRQGRGRIMGDLLSALKPSVSAASWRLAGRQTPLRPLAGEEGARRLCEEILSALRAGDERPALEFFSSLTGMGPGRMGPWVRDVKRGILASLQADPVPGQGLEPGRSR